MISPFVLRMVWRETRSSWRRLSFLVLCIAVGVGGVTAVKSFADLTKQSISLQARALSASDLTVHSNRPFTPEVQAALDGLTAGGARLTPSVTFKAMARSSAGGAVRLVDVRGIGADYPYYGEVITASGRPFRDLLRDGTALVHPSLLITLNLRVGDALRIGDGEFTISGEVIREPDGTAELFQFGPRVLLTQAGVDATGLVLPTSRIRYMVLARLAPEQAPAATIETLKRQLSLTDAHVHGYEDAQPRVRRFIGRLENYLSLLGLVALLLGGIGVAGAIRAFISQKLDTVAILKCLGATANRVLAIYLIQALLLGVAGSLLGVALGITVQQALRGLMGDFLPIAVEGLISPAAAAQGLALGFLTTLWFAVPPLWRARRTPPARVFRRDVEPPGSWRSRLPGLVFGLGCSLALVAALVFWKSGTWTMGWIILAVLTGTVAGLVFGTLGLLALLRALPRPRRFFLRQGLAGLYRPGNQTVSVVAALGLGVLLVLTVVLIRTDLLRQVSRSNVPDQPNIILIDIQSHQRNLLESVAREFGVDKPRLIPMLRGRIRALNGERLVLDSIRDEDKRRHLGFEYSFTYRGELEEGEEVLEGTFGHNPDIPGAQVSAAQWWTDTVGLGVGDTITMDVQGVPIPATITSIRKIDWGNRRANFSFVFMPGVLEDAPKVYVSALRIPDAAERIRFQQAVVARLPNVSVIDVDQVIGLVQDIMDRIAVVVQFMALFSVVAGLVILVGTISTTRYQRLRESVLLKTLGATRGLVARIMATEYALMGTLAGVVGALAAGVLSWGLVTLIFKGNWDLNLPPYLLAAGLTVVLITGTGLVSSLDILMKKPLQVLRDE